MKRYFKCSIESQGQAISFELISNWSGNNCTDSKVTHTLESGAFFALSDGFRGEMLTYNILDSGENTGSMTFKENGTQYVLKWELIA